MEKQNINETIIGFTYKETINYFVNIKPLYFRPIKINNTVLFKDDNFDLNRCNIIFENSRVILVDGWY